MKVLEKEKAFKKRGMLKNLILKIKQKISRILNMWI